MNETKKRVLELNQILLDCITRYDDLCEELLENILKPENYSLNREIIKKISSTFAEAYPILEFVDKGNDAVMDLIDKHHRIQEVLLKAGLIKLVPLKKSYDK